MFLWGISGGDIYGWIMWVLSRDRREDACIAQNNRFDWCD